MRPYTKVMQGMAGQNDSMIQRGLAACLRLEITTVHQRRASQGRATIKTHPLASLRNDLATLLLLSSAVTLFCLSTSPSPAEVSSLHTCPHGHSIHYRRCLHPKHRAHSFRTMSDDKKSDDYRVDIGSAKGSRAPSPVMRSPQHHKSISITENPVAAILAYCGSSILMTVTNKYVLSGVNFNLNFFLLCVQVRCRSKLGCYLY